jgi:hypothetical protein
MTGEQIKAAAERYIGDTLDPVDALEGINQALVWLADRASLWGETVINAAADTWYDLPNDCIGVLEVAAASGEAREYVKRDNRIKFAEADTYTVRYRRLPREMTALTETPEVHQAFHRVLVTGLKAWWKLMDDEENPDGLRLLAKFERDAEYAAALVRRKSGPATVQVVR